MAGNKKKKSGELSPNNMGYFTAAASAAQRSRPRAAALI